jgi:secretory phospholipase A2
MAAKYYLPFNDKFKVCCDKHDICYGTCGAPNLTVLFKKCNNQFKDCIVSQCGTIKNFFSQKACKFAADALYEAVNGVGGQDAYVASQKQACKCQ